MKKKIDISKLTTFEELKVEWMKDPGFRREYQKVQPHYQLARQIIGARLKKKMTQAELAKKAKTGQAVISRLEGMNAQPTISLLQRIAQALNTKIELTIR
ncbi:MAG: Helix-turn-helix domain protein [Candidatus Beckwithbacteria bacterium GW2011_GWB1_47_15]|uniref:Helix-turn-helix domain protein n=1 Tax=Candidatus Beckwithbacteria bacterium GW2011_GWB1_47_15 TaxID=1618371 RepID=A0A0G1RX82_9BACT|nr:MAG: helix-turn-helix domain-containing protein [Candidatus Beckwithbacteria bacterium GW2011_GWC1_49_16]AQS30785.1 hypothetical protein [uncultured bacterium]KKU35970.1 MAG: Helix-turn-helix domain protein [Candidatus Beckwithbacteria bacterium GW2011_GWA1_46_30]KKU61934.1 MAG: Helix-turn-helix domain protein [Candidatus Beckwithbacteria bacterium GW2011_GWB1_47_15]KKU72512.1 MAG: Helix-turn-helix domain protein [Candidatus Beckwithbacteria bacterium GW2011_GWA2_47_25]KKW04321.1 MAG: Helix